MERMTPIHLRPFLPESIVPLYLLPDKECPPWPYRERNYRLWHTNTDNTTKRFDENTRLITVEGNFGSNVSKLARELAQVLGFHYIPQPRIEDILVDSYGIDWRNYFHLLPEKFCYFDTEMFFYAPDHPSVNARQYYLYALKFEAYCNALAHILNTGQGVVLERSVMADSAFNRALYEKKFTSEYFAKYYPQLKEETTPELQFLPHIVIYLDTPVSKCMENIKQRARPWEVDSRVVDYDYLSIIEDELKKYLARADKDSYVLALDWKTPAETDSVAEEIYKIDMTYDWNIGDRYYAWNDVTTEYEWNEYRHKYTDKLDLMTMFSSLGADLPETTVYPHEEKQLRYVSQRIVGKYAHGFNMSRGDKLWDILFPKSDRKIVNYKWVEYLLRDATWSRCYTNPIYTEDPDMPNIPLEEFEPRRFDPTCLKDWSAEGHHH